MTEHKPHHHAHGPANRRRRVQLCSAPLFVREPTGPIRGGVIVLHDDPGLTERIERYCRRLATEGWLAVAPYHYYQLGGREFPDPDAAPRLSTPDELYADATGALDHLRRHRGLPDGSVAVLGVGRGAHLAAWLYARHRLAALLTVEARAAPLPGMAALTELLTTGDSRWFDLPAEDGDGWPAARPALRAGTPRTEPTAEPTV